MVTKTVEHDNRAKLGYTQEPMQSFDTIILGGGIVGLATAYQLGRLAPDTRIVVLEKETQLAHHQTGHNSGVLHAGIYYRPGSLKAEHCRSGKAAMEEFCGQEEIPFERCGKVVVALDASQVPALNTIHERAQANGVDCERIGPERLKELEPHAAGIDALHVPETGIVDYRQVADRLAQRIQQRGAEIRLGCRVTNVSPRSGETVVESTQGEFGAKVVVNCGGLFADRVARWAGQRSGAQIVPFRGEYYQLKPAARHLCRNLIYPVPDPSFPFLGVHFTRRIGGDVECGPNAVLAGAREGYRKTDLNLRDLAETLSYPGFLKLATKYWRTGLGEMWRSVSKAAFVAALQRLVPELRSEHLEPAPAGVRAQALTPQGGLVDDFLIVRDAGVISVCNAPSPAATSSLRIGETIAAAILSGSTGHLSPDKSS